MKFVVSDPKSGKAYSAKSEEDLFLGKKIGDTVKLDEISLTGFEAVITGGSDKQGFPMNKSVHTIGRKRIFTTEGIGFKAKRKGERKRLSARGNTVSNAISQVNLAISKVGSVDIAKVFAKEAPKSDEEVMSAKELALKKSKEMAGSAEIEGPGKKKARH